MLYAHLISTLSKNLVCDTDGKSSHLQTRLVVQFSCALIRLTVSLDTKLRPHGSGIICVAVQTTISLKWINKVDKMK